MSELYILLSGGGELLNRGEKWSLYYEPLDIFVSAPTLDECKEYFQEEFFVLCEEYVEEADEKLTESARELKRRLKICLDNRGVYHGENGHKNEKENNKVC